MPVQIFDYSTSFSQNQTGRGSKNDYKNFMVR
jgi:hypothetical protein